MNITLCGSMKFIDKMETLARQLEAAGHIVYVPDRAEGTAYDREQSHRNGAIKQGFMFKHFAKTDKAEAVLVVNEPKNGVDGYIGGSTLIEMAYALNQGLSIFALYPLPELSYSDELRCINPVVLGGDVMAIEQYLATLPLVYMSTESTLKHLAVARGFRRAGLPVRVEGVKVESGVSEQPLSFEETLRGALERFDNLRRLGKQAEYLVSVESGLCQPVAGGQTYGAEAIVIQHGDGDPFTFLGQGIIYPQEMLDKVPSQYPDLGVLVQQEYGVAEKDPVTYITGGVIHRQQMIEEVVHKAVVQMRGNHA